MPSLGAYAPDWRADVAVIPRLGLLGRLLIIGDAAFSARPHVGMGVTKAAEDALLLGKKLTKVDRLEDALVEWERARHIVGEFIVNRGRVLGSYLAGDHAQDRWIIFRQTSPGPDNFSIKWH